MEKQLIVRNNTIDIVKAISAYLVVTIHYGFPIGGVYENALARIAVPFFFIVSGYYISADKVIYRIKHIVSLIICGECVYCIFYFIYNQFTINNMRGWFLGKFSAASIAEMLLTSGGFFDINWFLFGLLYMYMLYAILYKANFIKLMYLLSPCVLLGWCVAQRYVAINPNAHWMWNFPHLHVVKAFPFFAGGVFVRNFEKKILNNINEKVLIIAIVIGFILTIGERYLYSQANMPAFSIYIGTIIQVPAFFIFSLKRPNYYNMPFLSYVGKNLSMYIYLLHVMVFKIIDAVLGHMDVLWVCLITTGVSWIIHCIITECQRKIRQYRFNRLL